MEPEAYEELDQLEATHWWYEGMRRITAGLIERYIGNARQITILDAGCGAGGNLTAFARWGCAYGIDYSPLALQFAHQRHPDSTARASVEHLPFADATFDLVTSFDVLYHRGVQDDQKAFREFARVTRPGGWVLVRLPALEALRGTHDIVVHGARRYTANLLAERLRDAGLQPKQITYANTLLLPAIFAARKIEQVRAQDANKLTSDTKAPSSLVNTLLTQLMTLEARWIGGGHRFPAGVSVIGIAQKDS
jgi:SAM-dependent methyltransferase